MTDLEKIAAILASNLDDALKLELVWLVASRKCHYTYQALSRDACGVFLPAQQTDTVGGTTGPTCGIHLSTTF